MRRGERGAGGLGKIYPVQPAVMLVRIAIAFLLAVTSASAADRVATAHAESALVPEKAGFTPGEPLWFAFHQDLQEGWHVYWRNPGDSGLPLDFRWTLPEGFVAGEIVYPLPERIPVGPLANFGHQGAPTFLVAITAPKSSRIGDQADIVLKATWLICEDICVPEEGAFRLSLAVAAAPPSDAEGADLVAEARSGLARPEIGPSQYAASGGAIVVETAAPERAFADAFFFPHAEGVIEPAAPQRVSAADGRVRIEMKKGFAAEGLAALDGVVVFTGADGAREGFAVSPRRDDALAPLARSGEAGAAGDGRAATASRPGSERPPGLAYLLLAAFFGGMLLNVMPCVFPVLFIKAASLAKGAAAAPAYLRRDAVLYTLGVVASFAALGALLLALRAGGDALGWGFHLQSPAVILVSAYVLFLVGLNLAGVFHIGESLQGVGGGLALTKGALGSFFTGALAVFVAAPCIGPLLSAPIGAAVLLPPASAMLIFLLLGLGLAAPYAVIALAPGLRALLPRPGAWMETFRQAMSFPVFAGAAFFLWVLAQQTGSAGLARGLAGALVLALAAWLFERSKGRGGRSLAARAIAAGLVVAALAPAVSLKLVEPAHARVAAYGEIAALPYDEGAIAVLRAQGRAVFVDFTAAWCITCQVNKLTIFSRSSVAEAFAANDVALMRADWTRRDPAIAAALAEFGANGVPFYVYYPPQGAPRPLALPLTERRILQSLETGKDRS